MKQINKYWVDENNNRWDIEIYTEEQAEKFSKSLVNCYNCHNCRNCHDCYDCYDCDYCDYCDSCYDCDYCHNCDNCRCCDYCHNCGFNCRYCHNCDYCDNCDNCRHCRNCRYCHNCDNCRNCYDYKQNPQRYTTKNIGSRNDQTTFYYGETKNGMEVQVVCGCFRGNLEKFEKAVLETHKDNDLYREQYLKEIEKVKILFDLEVE